MKKLSVKMGLISVKSNLVVKWKYLLRLVTSSRAVKTTPEGKEIQQRFNGCSAQS